MPERIAYFGRRANPALSKTNLRESAGIVDNCVEQDALTFEEALTIVQPDAKNPPLLSVSNTKLLSPNKRRDNWTDVNTNTTKIHIKNKTNQGDENSSDLDTSVLFESNSMTNLASHSLEMQYLAALAIDMDDIGEAKDDLINGQENKVDCRYSNNSNNLNVQVRRSSKSTTKAETRVATSALAARALGKCTTTSYTSVFRQGSFSATGAVMQLQTMVRGVVTVMGEAIAESDSEWDFETLIGDCRTGVATAAAKEASSKRVVKSRPRCD